MQMSKRGFRNSAFVCTFGEKQTHLPLTPLVPFATIEFQDISPLGGFCESAFPGEDDLRGPFE